MTDPLAGLDEAVAGLRAAWTSDAHGALTDAAALGRAQLVAVLGALGGVARNLDVLRTQVAAEIERESRPELGPESLAKEQGFRSPTAFISTTTGVTAGEAHRLIKVGTATKPRMTLTGDAAPARHPHVAAALTAARIGAAQAEMIIRMLDRAWSRANSAAADAVEKLLAERAAELSLDDLARLITRAEAQLDPDGLEPKEQELRQKRYLRMFERDGMLHLDGAFDPESGAPLKTAIEAIVSAEFRSESQATAADVDAPRRIVIQRQADALVMIAMHVAGCASDLPMDGATVVVRMTLEQLETGSGIALVDGLTQPVSAATARRMAASGGVIPLVLDGCSEILDWGREKRLFTKPQKLALAERDGGCAMCGLPPGMTKAHHLRWWSRDAGPTDLDNGVLLCESCHHRIHDNGWEIRIEGKGIRGRVWFIPPAHVDLARTPRLGGRARFDLAA